jgi:hypothetical protein
MAQGNVAMLNALDQVPPRRPFGESQEMGIMKRGMGEPPTHARVLCRQTAV